MGNFPFHFCPRLVFGIVTKRDRRNEAFGQFNHHDLDRVHQYYVAVAVAIRAMPTMAAIPLGCPGKQGKVRLLKVITANQPVTLNHQPDLLN